MGLSLIHLFSDAHSVVCAQWAESSAPVGLIVDEVGPIRGPWPPREDHQRRGRGSSTVDSGDFATFWDGVWGAVVTVTTVGYGDLCPHTVARRSIGIAVMLLGVGFLAVLTATVASHFVQVDSSEDSREILVVLERLEADVAELNARPSER